MWGGRTAPGTAGWWWVGTEKGGAEPCAELSIAAWCVTCSWYRDDQDRVDRVLSVMVGFHYISETK